MLLHPRSSRSRAITFIPVLILALATVGIFMRLAYDVLGPRRISSLTFIRQYAGLNIALFALTLLLSWYITAFICCKLWGVDRQMRRLHKVGAGGLTSRYRRIMRVLIQSGALYSLTLGTALVCTATGDVRSLLVDHTTERGLLTFFAVGYRQHNALELLSYLYIRVIGLNTTLIVLVSFSFKSNHYSQT